MRHTAGRFSFSIDTLSAFGFPPSKSLVDALPEFGLLLLGHPANGPAQNRSKFFQVAVTSPLDAV